jgi:primary-amine oxidase
MTDRPSSPVDMAEATDVRAVGRAAAAAHPLDALTAEEIRVAVSAARASGRLDDHASFAAVTLEPPPKASLAAHRPGDPVERRVRLVVVPGQDSEVIEALIDGGSGKVLSWEERPDMRPALLFDDALRSINALRRDPDWQQAMRRRGITDFDQVQIDPWPTGNFGRAIEEDRRITRCLSYYREAPTDNGYARPVEGVIATVDGARGEVLEVVDYGVVPIPAETGSYYPEDHQPTRPGLRPLEIVQPEGPSFTVESNLIRWQGWSLRVSMDPNDGLVLHTVGYAEGDRVRPVLHRASITEMVVPYGDPGPAHGWKNAFDAGEWGLGRMVNSLRLGCDCLGVISYLDATFSTERGEPFVVENAICIHEEDYGILWKHQDMHIGRTEVRRSRRLVVSSISTVGNYEYGFYWYFYLDGTIQLEVKLTGILSTQATAPGERSRFAPAIAPGLAAPVHQHLFCARLDLEVDGPVNEVFEVSTEPLPAGPDNPWSNGFVPVSRRLDSELAARRNVDPASGRHWRFVNPEVRNRLGEPVAYKLLPSYTPIMLARPESSVGRRAGFARHNLWVTPFDPTERRGAGDYPNQHAGGDGLPAWTAADRSLVGTDIVAWHTFGVTHVPRPEDWPVMPVEYCGFQLIPVGFFGANPALDVPPPPACH